MFIFRRKCAKPQRRRRRPLTVSTVELPERQRAGGAFAPQRLCTENKCDLRECLLGYPLSHTFGCREHRSSAIRAFVASWRGCCRKSVGPGRGTAGAERGRSLKPII